MIDWIATREPSVFLPRLQTAVVVLSMIFFPLTGLSVIWSDWLISLLYPAYYIQAAALVKFLALTGSFSVLSLVAVATILIANKPNYYLPINAGALLANIMIGLFAIPRWGALGAVLGVLASEALILFSWIILGKKLLRNLNLSWVLPFMLACVDIVFILTYRPGLIIQEQVLADRALVTILFLTGMSVLIWKYHPVDSLKYIRDGLTKNG